MSALGNSSDTKDENAEEVSAPFCAPHLWWKACISGPNTDLPITIPMLLDSGAHIVLIHTDLVNEPSLHCCLLPKPETVNVAVNSSNALAQTMLTEWVKLSVTSQDGLWTS